MNICNRITDTTTYAELPCLPTINSYIVFPVLLPYIVITLTKLLHFTYINKGYILYLKVADYFNILIALTDFKQLMYYLSAIIILRVFWNVVKFMLNAQCKDFQLHKQGRGFNPSFTEFLTGINSLQYPVHN